MKIQSQTDDSLKKKYWFQRHKTWTFIIGLFLLISVINGISTGGKGIATSTNRSQQSKEEAVFDVPSLLGKNIDEIRKILGNPTDGDMNDPTKAQLQSGGANMEWSNGFEKDGKNLLVTYQPRTRKVIDFFISSDAPDGLTQDKDHLMALGNLTENDRQYDLEFVKALKDPAAFTGVKIVTTGKKY